MALELLVDSDVRLPSPARAKLRIAMARMVRAAALTDGRGRNGYEVALRIVCDPTIHALNRDYRGKDRPTDVLAFAQREGPAGALHAAMLGDIVISIDTARRQAKRGLYAELLHLASHGLCHLLGYDHRDDAEERTMNTRAAALRAAAARSGRTRAA